MKNIFDRFIKTCPKSGKFRGFRSLTGFTRIFLPLVGLLALAWILFRVLSKPSRINYPCVQTAMPFASGFIGEIIILGLSAFAFMKSKRNLLTSPAFLSVAFVVMGLGTFIIGGGISDFQDVKFATLQLEPNEPVGEAKGIFPGRVVWVHNPDATNEDCIPNQYGHAWFLNENNNQEVIDSMVSDALQEITGEDSDYEAWDAVFKYHNNIRGKGETGYAEGEKIFIKINATSSWWGNFNQNDLSVVENNYYGISETSPQLVLSVLRQLVDTAGVAQSDIYIGDPMKHIYKHCFEIWNAEYPDVHYLDHDSRVNREKAEQSTTAKIKYSDRGTILKTNVWNGGETGEDIVTEDYLYSVFEEAEYLINLPALKGHKRAGITAFAKNHFGSHTRNDAAHLHNGLVRPTEAVNMPGVTRYGYGLYRVQVDLMGHELLGRKNLLYLMDALWSADQEISYPKKFQMAPFNNDWMSSVFVSLDPVAIESVGYDFLRTEFTEDRPDDDGAGTYAQMEGADDYLHQAASSENWPDSLVYDPEDDGTPIASLGVHEHWNNPGDKQYSRNLGTGDGIELIKAEKLVSVKNIASEVPSSFDLYQNYPNPFNPSTNIKFDLKKSGNVSLKIYDVTGSLVEKIIDNEFIPAGTYNIKFNADKLSSGIYILKMTAGSYGNSLKMVLMR